MICNFFLGLIIFLELRVIAIVLKWIVNRLGKFHCNLCSEFYFQFFFTFELANKLYLMFRISFMGFFSSISLNHLKSISKHYSWFMVDFLRFYLLNIYHRWKGIGRWYKPFDWKEFARKKHNKVI